MIDPHFSAADYRVRLFLSVDLSGSTAFKSSFKGQTISDGASPRWVAVFQHFYSDFPARFSKNFQDKVNAGVGSDRCPSIWKAVGDELIFCGRVTNKVSLVTALTTFIKTLLEYRAYLASEDLELNLKGAGWLAAFPEPNRAVEVKPQGNESGFLSASEALEKAADDQPFGYDFLGKGIDTGFRVASKAQPERFSLSVQLARLLTCMPRDTAIAYDIHADHPVELKGVNRGIPYPVLYIETLEHLPLAKIREAERRILLRVTAAPSRDEVAAYLATYCEVAGTDEIMLPERADDTSRRVPDSYSRHRELIEAHLAQERGRGAEAAEELAGPPMANGDAEELHADDNMTPLPEE